MIGRIISHYRVLAKIGEGGMGIVYKAEDTKLKRTVALKFLPPDAITDEEEKTRLIHEAQAEAKLDHPNVCTIHEIEETDGTIFIAMAYCEGQSLRKRIRAGPLSLLETLDIAIQIASGLTAAHEKNVVHRDIKPGNIMLTTDGCVKITDFGLAKLTGTSRTTSPGGMKGTVSYMAPEQIRGQTVDRRSDIWSLGVILYELVTGRLPFQSEYDAAVLYSIVTDTPVAARELNQAVPASLDRIIETALQKNPDDRFASMKEMLDELKQLRWELMSQELLPSGNPAGYTKPLIGKRIALSGAALVLAVLLVLVLVRFQRPTDDRTPISIAVLDFENHSQDSTFTTVLGELLRTDLIENPFTRILSRDRLDELRRDSGAGPITPATGMNICRLADIQAMIYPKVVQVGNTYRLEAVVYDVGTAEPLFVKRVRCNGTGTIIESIEALSDEIIADLKLLPREGPITELRRSNLFTASIEAYKFYCAGYDLYEGADPPRAIPLFEQAIAIDSTFIDAHLTLAILLNYIGDPRAILSARRAKRIAEAEGKTLAFLEALIVEARIRGDWNTAIGYMKQYLEIKPDDIDMHLHLGYVLSRRLKAFEESIVELEKVVELDPKNLTGRLGPTFNWLGHAHCYMRRYDKAIECLEAYRAHVPNKPDPFHSLGDVCRIRGDYHRAVSYFSDAIALSPSYYEGYEDLGLTYLAMGKWQSAIGDFRRYISTAPLAKKPWGHVLVARAHLLQGDVAAAWHELDDALRLDEASYHAYWLRGLIALLSNSDLEAARNELDAIDRITRTCSLPEAEPYYRHLLGWVLLAEGNDEEGIASLDRAAELSQREFIFFGKELVRGLLVAGRYVEAGHKADELMQYNDTDGELLWLLGLIHEQTSSAEEVKACLLAACNAWSDAEEDFVPLSRVRSRLDELR